MSDVKALKRNLAIKTGAAKRLLKEHNAYRAEAAALELKRDKLAADGAEAWDIKNATKMTEESNKLIVDTAKRLGDTVQALRDLVVSARQIEQLVGSPELLAADDILEEASI